MASSGTFTSGRYGGGSYGPWLTLAWTQVSQSVANNTTTLDLTLRFHWDANISYTFRSRAGSVQGNSYTYSGSVSGTSGVRVLRTQRVTVSHNSNGTKSISLSGNITSLGINWSGSNIGTMSVSGTANLNTIPRATSMSAFSFNANLKNGTANQINYTIDRKSTAFRHQIQLRDGATVLRTWDNVDSNGASTLALTATEVNTLLNRMSTSTTKSYTLRVATRSGSGGSWIGDAVSRNATATVHADVKPTVSAVTLSQTGNTITTHTLQGFSKIKASFTRSAGYGASISSSSIQVRRRSGGADSQTINSNDGTTANAVALNGVYEARGTTRDSRGRTTNTAWATITVTAYSAPTITSFSAVRNGTTATTVNISRATTHTVLGTSNHLSYSIQRRQGTGAWTNVNTGATGSITTSGATGSATSTGNSVTQSYEFRLVVTDKFGGKAESLQTVSTQRVVLDIHKNEGVGIGKIHEEGVLDVDGSAYFHGPIYIPHIVTRSIGHSGNFNDADRTSFYHMGASAGQNPSSTWGFLYSNTNATEGNSPATQVSQIFHERDGAQNMYSRSKSNDAWKDWKMIAHVQRGSNSNGEWVRFSDGTQICWKRTLTANSTHDRYLLYEWTYPQSFLEDASTISATKNDFWGGWVYLNASVTAVGWTNSARIRLWRNNTDAWASNSHTESGHSVHVVAIGRWK